MTTVVADYMVIKTTYSLPAKYGRLTALECRRRGRIYTLLCRCDCGKVKEILCQHVRCKKTTSCGCYGIEVKKAHVESHTKHNLSHRSEYYTWYAMLNRCLDEDNNAFHHYGGRGIKVCDRWQGEKGVENFFADMGPKPTPKHEIDRINNDGNYEPGNCRWATRAEQTRNTRKSVFIEFAGFRLCAVDWALLFGVTTATFKGRHKRWGLERTIASLIPVSSILSEQTTKALLQALPRDLSDAVRKALAEPRTAFKPSTNGTHHPTEEKV